MFSAGFRWTHPTNLLGRIYIRKGRLILLYVITLLVAIYLR